MKISPETAVATAVAIVVSFVIVGALLFYVASTYHFFTPTNLYWLRAALTLVIGVAALVVLERLLRGFLAGRPRIRNGGLILSVFRYVAYAILALAILASLGVSNLALLAGGTFAGLVLGLASQTALSNVISGLVLLATRPFRPGDRVTLITWQFGVAVPAYPPKFYSQDVVYPGYTGIVRTIGIVYSEMQMDEGPTIQVPNGILLQAMILNHEIPARWVRAKYELAVGTDLRRLLPLIRAAVQKNEWIVNPENVRVLVNQATASTTVISVDALCRGNAEEPARSAILIDIVDTVRAAAPAPAPPPGAIGR
ncbi:MAG: mechanosensitive ion channel family protein [Thermoplasmata archaeon]|jgi:small-conductance mechanosensitive channel